MRKLVVSEWILFFLELKKNIFLDDISICNNTLIVVRRLKTVRFHEKSKKHSACFSPTHSNIVYLHGNLAREFFDANKRLM